MNILVLSDNTEVLERAKPIFLKRSDHKWIFTNSDDINPKLDYKHIIKTYDLVFSLHCKKIFPKELVNGVRCVNIHPGYNPYNRGMYPHVWSIVNGKPAGVTIHLMDEGIDSGPYYVRWAAHVAANDTSETLYETVLHVEMMCIDFALDGIIDQTLTPKHYTETGNYNSLVDYKKLCSLSTDKYREFFDTVRALSHGHYWNAHLGDIYLKLLIKK